MIVGDVELDAPWDSVAVGEAVCEGDAEGLCGPSGADVELGTWEGRAHASAAGALQLGERHRKRSLSAESGVVKKLASENRLRDVYGFVKREWGGGGGGG